MNKIKKGDEVRITAGKDTGKTGTVEQVHNQAVVVRGINIYKKHVRARSDRKGGIIEYPRPLPLGTIALICPKCKKPTRVGFARDGSTKQRICRKCKEVIA